jgi:outer membrane receptor protein involved in Fe transport
VNILGAETGLEARIGRAWSFLLSYAWVQTRVVSAPGNESLLGKQLANAPRHRANVCLAFDEPRWFSATLEVRVLGPHFEDELNELELGGYVLLDASVSRRLLWDLELFAAAENLLNRPYLVGRAGIDTYGAPFMARAGLRLRH